MGFFDKAKVALGLGGAASPSRGQKVKEGRPPLRDLPSTASESLDDAFAARDAGRRDEARSILATLDRGKGLRTVLRAAAALEAEDEEEVASLLPAIQSSVPPWMLALQIASVASGAVGEDTSSLVGFARARGAPSWALAWVRACSHDPEEARRGMVDLLFADAGLARTVAARDWKLAGAVDDRASIERYATFAHGRDAVRRFGAAKVREVFARAHGIGIVVPSSAGTP